MTWQNYLSPALIKLHRSGHDLIYLYKDTRRSISTFFKTCHSSKTNSLSFCKSAKRQIWIQHSEQFSQPVFCGHWIRSQNLFLKSPPTLSKANLVHVFSMWSEQRHLLSSSAVASRTRNCVVTHTFAISLFSIHATLWISHLK